MRVTRKHVGAVAGLLLGGYVIACALRWSRQDDALFLPSGLSNKQIARIEREFDAESFELEVAPDAVLRGWFVPGNGDGPRPTVVFFGGQRQRAAMLPVMQPWIMDHGYNLVVVPYRGYGRSTGNPSVEALFADALVVHDYVLQRPEVVADAIVAYGFSLGTGVATYLATQRQLAGVVLAAPYSRLTRVAERRSWWYPARLLERNEIDTVALAPGVAEPALIVHGARDRLISVDQSAPVAAAWGGPASRVIAPRAVHRTVMLSDELRESTLEFLAGHTTGG